MTAWAQAPVPSGTTVGSWPIGDGRAMREVRRMVASHAELGDDLSVLGSPARRLELVFSELVSNALRHGHQPVEVALYEQASHWLLVVVDSSIAPPEVKQPGMYDAGGRGLTIVARLSDRQGWAIAEGKKHVWAEIPAVLSIVDSAG